MTKNSRPILPSARKKSSQAENRKDNVIPGVDPHLSAKRTQGAALKDFDANLSGAILQGADFQGANLRGVELRGANLTQTVGPAQEQLDQACGNATIELPNGLGPADTLRSP